MVKARGPYPVKIVTIPEGQVWVEGDEGFHSLDSNSYGPVIHLASLPSISGSITRQFTNARF